MRNSSSSSCVWLLESPSGTLKEIVPVVVTLGEKPFSDALASSKPDGFGRLPTWVPNASPPKVCTLAHNGEMWYQAPSSEIGFSSPGKFVVYSGTARAADVNARVSVNASAASRIIFIDTSVSTMSGGSCTSVEVHRRRCQFDSSPFSWDALARAGSSRSVAQSLRYRSARGRRRAAEFAHFHDHGLTVTLVLGIVLGNAN